MTNRLKLRERRSVFTASVFVVAVLAIGYGLSGCPSSNTTTPTTAVNYTGTQSPGDLWTATFNSDGTFTASNTNANNAVTFSGTTQALASGFTKLTVTSVTTSVNPSPVVVGAVGYAFEFPGTALFLKPPGSSPGIPSPISGDLGPDYYNVSDANKFYNTKGVFLVARDASATVAEGNVLNWVEFPNESWTVLRSNAWGRGVVGSPTTTIPLDVYEFKLDSTQLTRPSGCPDNNPYYCTQILTPVGLGQATVTSGTPDSTCGSTEMYVINTFQISPSGAFMGDQTTPNCTGELSVAGFLGMKAPSVPVETASLFGTPRSFRGVLFRAKSSNGNAPYTEEVYAEITQGSSVIEGGNYLDVVGNSRAQTVQITLGSQDGSYPGVFPTAVILNADEPLTNPPTFVNTNGDQDNAAVFMVNQIGGKYFLFGVLNTNPSGEDYPANFLLIEQ